MSREQALGVRLAARPSDLSSSRAAYESCLHRCARAFPRPEGRAGREDVKRLL